MNRPRNRQPRQNQSKNQHQHRHSQGQNHARPPTSKPTGRVPDISQVLPGASVSIVLKADQPTGHENQGIVQDVLTRGNHPRGIKVRLKDGRVGRVQRMAGPGEVSNGGGERWPASVPTSPVENGRTKEMNGRAREGGENGGGSPVRSLADFIPDSPRETSVQSASLGQLTFASATATCPICGLFEGDEAAVSHHVQSHLD